MKMLELHPIITRYASVEEWFQSIQLRADDLIVTNRFLVNQEVADAIEAQVLYQEDFGQGEPSDEMLIAMLKSVRKDYHRVIGIGGGTVMDLSKMLCLSYDQMTENNDLYLMMMGKLGIQKRCPVLLAPSTCGTGSEVTNVAVLLLKSRGIKVGLANAALYAEEAALISTLVRSLPYRPMILSAIDALIHACESFLSPKANELTRPLSEMAMQQILESFQILSENELKPDNTMLDHLLTASTLAGIAFGNAGCGIIHAMSYPIGGAFHLPHGEANYEVFLPVLRFYEQAEKTSPLTDLKYILAEVLSCRENDSLNRLETLLEKLLHRRKLKEFGMTAEQSASFAADVWEKQQRLLKNAMIPVSMNDLVTIFENA